MLLCLACGEEFAADDPRILDSTHPNYGNCPGCGENNIPADLSDKVAVEITWHELRVLVIWAEFWASHHAAEKPVMQKVVYGIADRLQMQHMERPGLTFASEISELRAVFGDANVDVIGFNESPPPEPAD